MSTKSRISSFEQLFQSKELSYIFGKRRINLFSLGLISFLALIAVGHAVGSYRVLEQKMNDPYTKWLKVPVPARECKEAQKLNDLFSKPDVSTELGIDTVLNYSINFIRALNLDDLERYLVRYRTITPSEDLLSHILSDKNTIISYSEEVQPSENNCWMILTKEQADLLDIKKETRHIILNAEDGVNLRIPILAIVKDLPDVVDGIMCEHLHTRLYEIPWPETKFITSSGNNTGRLMPATDYVEFVSIASKIKGFESLDSNLIVINEEQWIEAKIWFKENLRSSTLDSINVALSDSLVGGVPITEYECYSSNWIEPKCHYYMSLMLGDLKKVRGIKKVTDDKFPSLEISLNQIINKENFATISFVTLLLTGLIVFLLGLSTILFLNSILSAYLNKVSRSIGSLKAFGLSDEIVTRSYIFVILKFVICSFLVGVFFSSIYYFIFKLISRNPDLLNILNPYVVLTLVVLLVISIFVSLRKVNSTLKKTPGDLIYNR